jgi:hypothetical protein
VQLQLRVPLLQQLQQQVQQVELLQAFGKQAAGEFC